MRGKTCTSRTKTAELTPRRFAFVNIGESPHPNHNHTSVPHLRRVLELEHRAYQGPQTLEIFDRPNGVARHFP